MAYDKVVDSSVLDAGLKAIADAIREKGGTSDNLAFPTAMAEAIAAIEAGGGAKMAYGTFTPTEKIGQVFTQGHMEVTHGLGEVPDFAMFFISGVGTKEIGDVFGSIGFSEYSRMPTVKMNNAGFSSCYASNDYGRITSTTQPESSYVPICCATENTIRFGQNNVYSFNLGLHTYFWVVGKYSE